MKKYKLKYKGFSFFYWDDGRRTDLILFKKWRFGWESQQSGDFLFLGVFYLFFTYIFKD